MTHYLNGFVPDIECPRCDGNGWIEQRNPRLGSGVYQEDCPDCCGHGWRPMTQDEMDDAAEAAWERVVPLLNEAHGMTLDEQDLHDITRMKLRLYDEIVLPSGEVHHKLRSTSNRAMNEADRAEFTTRALALWSTWVGVDVTTLRQEAGRFVRWWSGRMKLQSTHAILDVMKGRKKLAKHLAKNGPVRVTIEAEITYPYGSDDGESIEFCMDVLSVEVAE